MEEQRREETTPVTSLLCDNNDVFHWEHILVRLDVDDLCRCKRVSKSWKSLISDPVFIKAHLNHAYDSDGNTFETGHRRIVMAFFEGEIGSAANYEYESWFLSFSSSQVVGCSNVLVCVSCPPSHAFVLNPITRHVKKLQDTRILFTTSLLCWGFGHDSSTDDYKVVIGFNNRGDDFTTFRLLNLKSNVWKDVGQLKYSPVSHFGSLCSGALYWIMNNQNEDRVILSFNLSDESFGEFPQPDDARYKMQFSTRLCILEGRLCVFDMFDPYTNRWVLRNYNLKQSWERLHDGCRSLNHDTTHYLGRRKDYSYNKYPYLVKYIGYSGSWKHIQAPIFVRSLVSPHVNHGIPKVEGARR